ncbi:Fructose-bisphosphate aldolase 1, partial [Rhizina undulata]
MFFSILNFILTGSVRDHGPPPTSPRPARASPAPTRSKVALPPHTTSTPQPILNGLLDADEKHFAEHGELLFSSHMIDFSEEEKDWNIGTTRKYLELAVPMKQWLEKEIGITRGEEDGVDNTGVDTQPEDIYCVSTALSP